MKYILIGLLVSIGWHVATLIYDMAYELLFSRLHNTKWYLVAAGKKPKEVEDKPGDAKTVKNKIGFY